MFLVIKAELYMNRLENADYYIPENGLPGIFARSGGSGNTLKIGLHHF